MSSQKHITLVAPRIAQVIFVIRFARNETDRYAGRCLSNVLADEGYWLTAVTVAIEFFIVFHARRFE